MTDPAAVLSQYPPTLGIHAPSSSGLTLPSYSAEPARVAPGYQFGRYRVEKCLGHGGMGAVYLATDNVLGRHVAIKTNSLLHNEADLNSGLRFFREAEVIANLNHPHIVRIFDVGLQDTKPYLVLEFLRGEHLGTLLRQKKRLDINATLQLILPVCSAIDCAHNRGILHLDLKPSNIFLHRDHRDRTSPKVLDFGVCSMLDVDPDLDPTRDDYAGTPIYMAPETLSGSERTATSDVFSLGVILYECLSGINPFAAHSSLLAIKQSIFQGTYPKLNTLIPNLAPRVSTVVSQALAPNIVQRYLTVKELGVALCRIGSDDIKQRWLPEFTP